MIPAGGTLLAMLGAIAVSASAESGPPCGPECLRALERAARDDSAAMAARAVGDLARWRRELRKVMRRRRVALGTGDPDLGRNLARLAEAHCAARMWDSAAADGSRALELLGHGSRGAVTAKLAVARAALGKGMPDSAEAVLRGIRSSGVAMEEGEAARVHGILASARLAKGERIPAVAHADSAFEAFSRGSPEGSGLLLRDREELAFVLAACGASARAGSIQRLVLADPTGTVRKPSGARSPAAERRGRLGLILQVGGDPGGADSCFTGLETRTTWSDLTFFSEMLGLRRMGEGCGAPGCVAARRELLRRLAAERDALLRRGDDRGAEVPAWRMVIAAQEWLGDGPSVLLEASDTLLAIYDRRSGSAFGYDVSDNALALARMLLELERSASLPGTRRARTRVLLGGLLLEKDVNAQARGLFEEALTALGKDEGEEASHWRMAALLGLAKEGFASGKYADAQRHALGLLRLMERSGMDSPSLMLPLELLSRILEARGEYVLLEAVRARQLRMSESLPTGAQRALFLGKYAQAALRSGKYRQAEAALREALGNLPDSGDDEPGDLAAMRREVPALLATTLQLEGRYGSADSLQQSSWERGVASGEQEGDACALEDEESFGVARIGDCLRRGGLRYREGMLQSSDSLFQAVHEMCRRTLASLEDGPDDMGMHERRRRREQAAATRQALAAAGHQSGLVRAAQARADEADSLLGTAFAEMERSLGSDHPDLGVVLGDMAWVAMSRADFARADSLYARASGIMAGSYGGLHPAFGKVLAERAVARWAAGDSAAADSMLSRALAISRGSTSPVLEQEVALILGRRDRGAPDLAAFWGKMAVNSVQRVRCGIRDTLAGLSYVASTRQVYTGLVETLAGCGRLAEARHVLGLLKGEERSRFLGGLAEPVRSQVPLDSLEAAWMDSLDLYGQELSQLASRARAQEAADLGSLPPPGARGPEDPALAERAAQARFDGVLGRLRRAFPARPAGRAGGRPGLRLDSTCAKAVRSLDSGTVLLQYVLLDSTGLVLATTREGIACRRLAFGERQARRLVEPFLRTLEDPAMDPRPLAIRLHARMIAPLSGFLDSSGAKALLVSLDGPLRYLPLASLHDGTRYLVERYTLSVYTEASRGTLAQAPAPRWSVAGLGNSRAGLGFDSLPAVRQELQGIVREGPGDEGILPGIVRLDSAFTKASLRQALAEGRPVVHLASHFRFGSGGERDSYLLLGDRTRLDLHELRTGPYPFRDVELVTLSACRTAVAGTRNADGVEVEGLAGTVQEKGAKAVLASLWPVADRSTQVMMQGFYRAHEEGLSKSAALRQAQLALLEGSQGRGVPSRPGTDGSFVPPKGAPYAHPYYWAPFVLMGNGR